LEKEVSKNLDEVVESEAEAVTAKRRSDRGP
jgi:hypothetical protein